MAVQNRPLAPNINQPVIDVTTGKCNDVWYRYFAAIGNLMVLGPADGVIDGATAKFDGTTGRVIKE